MALRFITQARLKEIANAIRAKTGRADTIKVANMASEIASIVTSGLTLQAVTLGSNGTFHPDIGYDGFSEVIVDVPPTEPVLQVGSFGSNGTFYPDEGYDGFEYVNIVVPASDVYPAAEGVMF